MNPKFIVNAIGAVAAIIAALYFGGILGEPQNVPVQPVQSEIFNVDGEQKALIDDGKKKLTERQAKADALRAKNEARVQASYDSVMSAHANGSSASAPRMTGHDNSNIVNAVEAKVNAR